MISNKFDLTPLIPTCSKCSAHLINWPDYEEIVS